LWQPIFFTKRTPQFGENQSSAKLKKVDLRAFYELFQFGFGFGGQ
jgi:hypothetical protein